MNLVINGNNLIGFDDSEESKKILNEMGYSDAQIEEAISISSANDLFISEKNIALQIMDDFNLGTGELEVKGADIADVRAYIQSIDPSKWLKYGHLQRAKIPRPSVFDRYKKNPYEL